MLAVRGRPPRNEPDRHRLVSTEGIETPVDAPVADAPADDNVLLRVRGLKKYFPVKQGFLRRTTGQLQAVDGVDLEVRRGETVGLVGESGCGKELPPLLPVGAQESACWLCESGPRATNPIGIAS